MRGFGSMDSDEQRDIALKGSQSVPDEERSVSQDREHASQVGRMDGGNSGGQQQVSSSERRQQGGEDERSGSGNFAPDRERASEAGRKGGQD